jgi:NAD(P)-dependent dehydrogenase (short-subunit alcohol dehydrogenase family)
MSYIEDLFALKNKVAVVTGGTGVLGSEMCLSLSKAGARVVVLGRRKEAAEELVQKIKSLSGNALVLTPMARSTSL